MYVYQMAFPIDDFGTMRRFRKYYEEMVTLYTTADHECTEMCDEYYSPYTLHMILRRSLRHLARVKTYWEGDVRGDELYIGSMLQDEDSDVAHYIALKQDNNGSTFIISEIALPHLRERLIQDIYAYPITQVIQDGVKKILEDFAALPKSESLE